MMKSRLVQMGNISGMYYPGQHHIKTVVVYGLGAPTLPDNGDLPEALTAQKLGYHVFVPDYYGFGRSRGVFTPTNCIKTFLDLFEIFSSQVTVIFVGRSLAGAYLPLLPRFNKKIDRIGLIYGALDQSKQGEIGGEETNPEFIQAVFSGEYRQMYHGFNQKVWLKHLSDLDGLSPMDNIQHLANTKLFVAHGLQDQCINYTKSVAFFEAITKAFPKAKNQFRLKLYKYGRHDKSTAVPAMKRILDFLDNNTIQ